METAFRDRSRRLVLFGALAVLCGAAATGLGLLHLALPLLQRLLPAAAGPAVDGRSLLMSALVWVLGGAILIAGGVGSIRRRRWVRPVMLLIGWIWLLSGLVVTATVWGLADAMILVVTAGMAELPAGVRPAVKGLLVAGSLLAGVALPALFVWAYHDRHVQPTCDAHGPASAWSGSLPAPVSSLGVGLVAAAVLLLPLALKPALPFFGTMLTGWPGAFAILLTAAACGVLGRWVLRRERRGWWGTLCLTIALGVSMTVTLVRVETAELYRALGYREEEAALLATGDAALRPISVGSTVLLTVLSVAYLAAVRRHFR